MSVQPRAWPEVPEQTALVARAAFPKGTLAMRVRDELPGLFADGQNEHHLRTLPDHYAAHYNHRRPHRALQLAPPRPDPPIAEPGCTSTRRRPVLGGLLNEYEPTAA